MTDELLATLRKRAEKARAHFESDLAGQYLDVLKNQFPRGCCALVSELLLMFLQEHEGITGDLVLAEGRGEETHAWAEVDGYIVDITADQLDDFDRAVFVERTSEWHERWLETTRRPPAEALAEDHQREYGALFAALSGAP